MVLGVILTSPADGGAGHDHRQRRAAAHPGRAASSGPELSWVLNAYTLTFGGLLLLGARAGDLLGRRRTFLAGIAVFTVASLLGGFATTGWFLLAARALQGVGGALAAPSSLALLTTMFPEGRERMRAHRSLHGRLDRRRCRSA